MARYDVYAIGNALVDMEYEVDFKDLETLGIDKGVMTLVDESKQLEIMLHLAAHHHQRGSGGSAANTVIGLSQLGGKGFYSCKVADDELGHFYMRDLLEGGVDTNHHTEKDHGHTGRCVVLVTPDSDRTMCTFLGVSGNLSRKELVEDALRDSDWFYTEGYLVTSPAARAASVEARRIAERAGVRTAISLSDPNMVKFFKDGLLEMIGPGVDLIFANEHEAMGMAGTEDLGEAVAYLKTIRPGIRHHPGTPGRPGVRRPRSCRDRREPGGSGGHRRRRGHVRRGLSLRAHPGLGTPTGRRPGLGRFRQAGHLPGSAHPARGHPGGIERLRRAS